jgi:hypothetical protein
MKTLNRILTAVCLILAAHGTAHAQKSWNVATGNWSGTNNWSPSGVPVTGDAISIANGGTATLDASSTGILSLSIASGNVLQKDNTSSARSITLSTTTGLVTNAGTIRYSQGSATFTITSGSSGWNNSGLITAAVASELRIAVNAVNTPVINTGTMQADGGVLTQLTTRWSNMTNTGGVLRAINGGTIRISTGASITGGSVSVDAGSTFQHSRTNDRTDMTNVTVTNAGRMYTEQATNNNSMAINFLGTSTLTNSGTLEYIASGTTSGTVGPTASGSAANTATITNQAAGLIRVANTTTSATATAFFAISTPNFTNQGRIEVFSASGLTTGLSQLRSGTNVSNAGSILVDGPVSSIEMGARTFTQTAGALSLVNGGRMTAGSVLINSGTLLGTGTINAPVTIGGILSPGSGGIGTLSVSNGVTWNAGNAWTFELGTAAASLAAADTGSTGDLLALAGAFTQGTGTTFTFDFVNSGTDGWYKLVDYASTTFATGANASFAATNLPAGKSANFVVDSTTTALYVQIVPEPGAIALAAVGAAAAGLVCRKRRRDR